MSWNVFKQLRHLARIAVISMPLATVGCLGNLENSLSLVLSPGAFENALTLPSSNLLGLANLLSFLF